MASDGEISCTNDPNFAVIYSFLNVFGKLYGLEVPTIAKLQEFIENTQEVLEPLKELHLRLLRRAQKSVQSNRWERCLIKFCHQLGNHQEAWELERFSYKKASTQVKLKVLKLLLEYQFTCHPKFKTAVNAIVCKELRLDPIGRDKNGCVYWYQVDTDANLCLYKEDPDEETWQLVARSREELVKVISQLKSGEDICPLVTNTAHEDSSSVDVPPQLEPKQLESEGDNEDEFLSPESESEHEDQAGETTKSIEINKESSSTTTNEKEDYSTIENVKDTEEKINRNTEEIKDEVGLVSKDEEQLKENMVLNKKDKELSNEDAELNKADAELSIEVTTLSKDDEEISKEDEELLKSDENLIKVNPELSRDDPELSKGVNLSKDTDEISKDVKAIRNEEISKSVEEDINHEKLSIVDDKLSREDDNNESSIIKPEENLTKPEDTDLNKSKTAESCPDTEAGEVSEVGEAIEEPTMVVTGEGNGADCDSSYIGEEITEEIIFFYGEGSGYDNDTGNPEAIEQAKSPAENSDTENGNDELLNGEHTHELTNSSSKNKLGKAVKLKTSIPNVTKRSLKKQSNDTTEVLKPDSKKHCIRNSNKADSSNSKSTENKNEQELFVNDKSNTDSETSWKNRIKKGRTKVKKKKVLTNKSKLNETKEVENSVPETVNSHDSKTSIIEKRKSSVSSVEQEDGENGNTEKEKSPDEDLKTEEPLPPKKLRLESTPESDINESHSMERDPLEVNNSDLNNESVENQDSANVEIDSIAQRKKIKASKGKFKRKKLTRNNPDNDSSVLNKSTDKDHSSVKEKKSNKSLKRSLLDATMSDKNKSESHSESEDDEPVTSGKRLKIRPKKITKSSRIKVEAKLLEKQSTDESEEETLYSIAGKKASKKIIMKKKPRGKEKDKAKAEKGDSEDSDLAPVRQSRRIAQMKIKEEAERRHVEEVTLRELKIIHKKKNKDDEEEWQASGGSSSEGGKAKPRVRKDEWRAADSTGPDQDSDSDEPLFEVHEEPDLVFTKSDHEFSPESDLETDEPVEPLKRARTLQEGKDDGFCKRCGSVEQPEWILLCDRCDAGYHASCLKPMLFLVPEGDWHCPPCNHDMLIESLESELTKYDELAARVEAERVLRKQEQPEPPAEADKDDKKDSDSQSDGSGSSDWSSSMEEGAVYRLRARRQLPVSYRAQEYDRIISSAIKEEYVEPTTSAGNQGRGKDISTIIEAAEEEQREAEREALQQGKPIELKKFRKKARRKPRKLNSLDVPSEDDGDTDEDFKDTGLETSSEDISSSAERDSSNESRSSDSLPIRRTGRTDKKDRPTLRESSPEVKKKKKGVFNDTSSESGGTKEWSNKKVKKSKSSSRRDRSSKKSRKRSGHTQYDAAGNALRRVTYGGLSPEPQDLGPQHRTRQRKINYTETPNTESEDEMHKSSGKHMPDSSDEFKVDDSSADSDSDSDRAKRRKEEEAESNEERRKTLSDLIKKTVVVPLEKLPEDVTKAKTEELQAHLNAQMSPSTSSTPGPRARGGRGRGRGRGRPRPHDPDDALAKLVGVKIKDLKPDGTPAVPANQAEREKKRQEREAKQAEKEARKMERLQKKEEKEKLKEQKAKEREEKRLARIALQESKRVKKEKPFFPMGGNMAYNPPVRPMGPDMPRPAMYPGAAPVRHPGDFQEQQRFPATPRLQVRAELRGVLTGEERLQRAEQQPHRDGTLSVAGSPQPYKPIKEEPSIITRMPHMLNQQYRGPMMYPPSNSPYGPRGPQPMGMYVHPSLGPRPQYPPGYYPHLPYRGPQPRPGHSGHASPSPLAQGNNHSMNHGHNINHGQNQGQTRHPPPAQGHSLPHGMTHPPPHGPPAMALRPTHHPSHPALTALRPPLRPTPPPATPPSNPTPPVSSPAGVPEPEPIKIKAEVKTEPEYRSPAGSPSPRPPSPEPLRNHPKIKHTENKDRRPRYPLGPYAPQYGPYGPYAPDPSTLQRMHQMHQYLPGEREDANGPPPQYMRAPRPPFPVLRASPPYRPQYGEPRSPYGDQIRPPGPYGEPNRPPAPYGDKMRQPGPYAEPSRPPGPYSESARPPGPYSESTLPPGQYSETNRPPGSYSEANRPPGQFSDGNRPPGSYSDTTRPPGPFSKAVRPPGIYSETSRPPGPYSDVTRPSGPYSEGSRTPGPYSEGTRPPGPYSEGARLPGPYSEGSRPPGPYLEGVRPPGPYSEGSRPPGSYSERVRPPGSYPEGARPPGPYSEGSRQPGSYSEGVRPPGSYNERARPPGTYSDGSRPSGPYSEGVRPPGPYTEGARPPSRPFSEAIRPPGPHSEGVRPRGPFSGESRPPGPYSEGTRPPRPFSEATRPPGPFSEATRPSGPYSEAIRPTGPYSDTTRSPGQYSETNRPPGPYVEPTRPPGSYVETARSAPPYSEPPRPPPFELPRPSQPQAALRDRLEPVSPRPASRDPPQGSNGQERKSPPPAPTLSIKPEPGEPEPPPQPREEGSVFGGLVSYFSSQHEDDLDA